MNPTVTADVTATVRWNALERTILSHLYEGEANRYPTEETYSVERLRTLNGDVAKALDPESNYSVPERFHEPDHTDTVPLDDLFEKTETLLANTERMEILTETFRYDEDAEL